MTDGFMAIAAATVEARIGKLQRRDDYWSNDAVQREVRQLYERLYGTGPTVADPNVESVRQKLLQRAELGMKKYGVDTTTLSTLESLKHAQEEAMDLCVYLEQAIREMEA